MTFIKHSKISLRPFTQQDIPLWTSWFNNQELTKYMNKGHYPTLPEEQERRLVPTPGNLQLAVIETETGKLVGTVGLHDIDTIHRTASVSILIAEGGKGYGTLAISLIVGHALDVLNLRKLSAGVWRDNVACQKILEENRFIIEGFSPAQYYKAGEYIDALRYSLIRRWDK